MVFTNWRSSVCALFLLLLAWSAQSLSIIGPELVKLPSRPVHLNLTGFEFDAEISNNTGELIYQYGFSRGAPAEKYQLALRGLFETTSINGEFTHETPGSRIDFNNMHWEFSAPIIGDSSTQFTITGTIDRLQNATKPRFLSFIVSNTIHRGTRALQNDTIVNIDLDVEIDTFIWISPTSASKLILLYHLSKADESTDQSSFLAGNAVSFREAFFNSTSNGTSYGNDTVTARLIKSKTDEDHMEGIWMEYERFAGLLRHKSVFGVSSQISSSVQPNLKVKTGLIIGLVVVGILAVIGVIAGGVWYFRRRARNAEARRFV